MNPRKVIIAGLVGVAAGYAGTVALGKMPADAAGTLLFTSHAGKLGGVPPAVFYAAGGILGAYLIGKL